MSDEELSDLENTLSVLADKFRQELKLFLEGLPIAADEVGHEFIFLPASLHATDGLSVSQ